MVIPDLTRPVTFSALWELSVDDQSLSDTESGHFEEHVRSVFDLHADRFLLLKSDERS